MNHQTRVYENVFETLPSEENPTPLVRINKLNPCAEFPLYAKLEWVNPFGSVKDRTAWELLRDLEERGELVNGRGIVEPTSGNTGISMAAMARARGHRLLAIVPNKVPLEKKVLLKIVGADLEVISDELCPAPGLGDGSINLAKTHAKASAHKYAMPNQYENEKNAEAHFKTTGPEIWKQTEGKVIAPPGMTETAQRGGHIPGAKSVPWNTAVGADGTFKPAEELRAIYVDQKGVDPKKDSIAYCRIGERASHTWFVLKYLLGLPNVKSYDGSWTEYGSIVGAPIEK